MAARTKEEVKREFEDFARKIAKLETFRHELNSLDTKGFESDAKYIHSRLKDVHAIPAIERELKLLREKIQHRRAPVFGDARSSQMTKKALHLSEDLQEENTKIKKKIAELEKIIDEKRKVSVKKQLSKTELEFVKDVPKLERELHELRNSFRAHMSAPKVQIDSGVGLIVDTRFDDFIATIKAELSERMKEKETHLDAQLKEDLKTNEQLFKERYQELVKEYQDKYKERVHNELKGEVEHRFTRELQSRL